MPNRKPLSIADLSFKAQTETTQRIISRTVAGTAGPGRRRVGRSCATIRRIGAREAQCGLSETVVPSRLSQYWHAGDVSFTKPRGESLSAFWRNLTRSGSSRRRRLAELGRHRSRSFKTASGLYFCLAIMIVSAGLVQAPPLVAAPTTAARNDSSSQTGLPAAPIAQPEAPASAAPAVSTAPLASPAESSVPQTEAEPTSLRRETTTSPPTPGTAFAPQPKAMTPETRSAAALAISSSPVRRQII
jgi:hypothetical protein